MRGRSGAPPVGGLRNAGGPAGGVAEVLLMQFGAAQRPVQLGKMSREQFVGVVGAVAFEDGRARGVGAGSPAPASAAKYVSRWRAACLTGVSTRTVGSGIGRLYGKMGAVDPGLARITAVELRRRLDAQAGEVMATLSGAGVPAVVLKGLALEALLYERHEARPRSDTDVLVPDGLLARAEAVLAGLGFVLTTTEPHVAPDPRHARTWRRAADGALVDLHWRVYGSHAPAQQVWDVLSAHHAPLAVGGATLTVLDATGQRDAVRHARRAARGRPPRAAGGPRCGRRGAWTSPRGARPRRSPARSAPHEAFGDGLRVYSETAALADALAVPRSITRHRRHRTAGTRWDVTRPGVGPRRARLRRPGAAGGAARCSRRR